MKMKSLTLALGLSGTALAAALVLPAIAQESLLPEGFGKSADTPAPRPTPTPAPSPTPAPGPSPVTGSGTVAPPAVTATAGTPAPAEEGETTEEGEAVEPGTLKYDLPPGARRLLTRIGPLTPETGGLGPDAFGVRGQYAAAIMRKTNGALASRWGQILLRRSLSSAINTPATINGADLAAERAALASEGVERSSADAASARSSPPHPSAATVSAPTIRAPRSPSGRTRTLRFITELPPLRKPREPVAYCIELPPRAGCFKRHRRRGPSPPSVAPPGTPAAIEWSLRDTSASAAPTRPPGHRPQHT